MACQQIPGGFKCEKAVPVTFNSPFDPGNPLVTHTWLVDGSQVSTANQFQQTYPVTGLHTVEHRGINSCGANCTQTSQMEIVDVLQPPTPSGAAAAPAGAPVAIIAVVAVLAVVGIAVMRKK
jgi:hypothetical protein